MGRAKQELGKINTAHILAITYAMCLNPRDLLSVPLRQDRIRVEKIRSNKVQVRGGRDPIVKGKGIVRRKIQRLGKVKMKLDVDER